jgi:hypothetical protein
MSVGEIRKTITELKIMITKLEDTLSQDKDNTNRPPKTENTTHVERIRRIVC